MKEKRLCLLALAIVILLSSSAYAQYEALAGIPAESPEYGNYKMCIDSCSQCEANCKTNTYRMAAETQQKEDFCNYLPEAEKQPCLNRIYISKAIAGKDSAECQKITEDNERQGCLLNVQTEKAIEKQSETECISLSEGFAESCRQAFNMRMASLKSDKNYCDNIKDESIKGICKGSAAAGGEPSTAAEEEQPEMPVQIKSLITYGSIILGVIIFAVVALIAIKKIGRKKQAAQLVACQKQQGPPLVLQKEPVQQLPKVGAGAAGTQAVPDQPLAKQKVGIGTGVPDQLLAKQKAGETK